MTEKPVPLTGGHRNAVLRAGNCVLKTTNRSEAALRWLSDVYQAAHASGLFIPPLMESSAGTLVFDGWTCEPYFQGTPTPACQIKDRIKALHSCTANFDQRPGFVSARDLITHDMGGDVDMLSLPTRLRSAIRAAWAKTPKTADVIVHGDLNPANILTGPNGQIALIDWDQARCDNPIFDVAQIEHVSPQITNAAMAWEIACSWHIEPEYAKNLAARFLQ